MREVVGEKEGWVGEMVVEGERGEVRWERWCRQEGCGEGRGRVGGGWGGRGGGVEGARLRVRGRGGGLKLTGGRHIECIFGHLLQKRLRQVIYLRMTEFS